MKLMEDKIKSVLQFLLSDEEWEIYIQPSIINISNNIAYILTPNEYIRSSLQQRLASLSWEKIHAIGISDVLVKIQSETLFPGSVSGKKIPDRDLSGLNADYTFDTFVVGKSNQIAKAAAIQVAENPGTSYNPLFIYGGVGLGKTHLMHAIGNQIQAGFSGKKVLYVNSESFVSAWVNALRQKNVDDFKKRFRTLNALLIDDVQFFSGKEGSQEEFFYTFNSLFEAKQQIILTSDRFPKEVSNIEERLKSRFGWGLTVSIDPPDLETRVAIAMSKAQVLGIELNEDVAFFICKKLKSNIRELEGALKKLAISEKFLNKSIDIAFAKDILKDSLSAQAKQVSIENIQKVVADFYGIKLTEILSKSRSRNIVRPRQMAMALAKDLTSYSLPEIGKNFGGRDHTTVIHAAKRIDELRSEDDLLEEDYRKLRRKLLG